VIHGEIAQRLGEASKRRRERHTALDLCLGEREIEGESSARVFLEGLGAMRGDLERERWCESE